MDDLIFSLDIGTRKIAACLARKCNNGIEVVDSIVVAHKNRAVRSGQIHDIETVASIVLSIKSELERRNNIPILKVATAIAGRNLKCHASSAVSDFAAPKEINEEDMRNCELLAVQSVMGMVGDENGEYYFVGHAITGWEVDGESISHPLGHFCKSLKVNLVATFLPRKVLESHFSVARKTGLEISYLTLEPIAACESTVLAPMRHIPIVMIDIGAGTSDIATIAKGSVQSFGMIPIAGDFITESLCSEFLVDFQEGEKVKQFAGTVLNNDKNQSDLFDSSVKFVDIFTRAHQKTAAEIAEKIKPAINTLACSIGEHLKISGYLDNQQNYAIVLVGGGALTPFLGNELAAVLGIPNERIGIRSPLMTNSFFIKQPVVAQEGTPPLVQSNEILGPQGSVCMGVALLASQNPSVSMMRVSVNDNKIELLSFGNARHSVLSALLSAGITKNKIYGKPGLAKAFTLNGEMKIIKGLAPTAAKVLIDGNVVTLSDILKEGAKVAFEPALDGADAHIFTKDLVFETGSFLFSLNGEESLVSFPSSITVNGVLYSENTEIHDRDIVEIVQKNTLKDALESAGVSIEQLNENVVSVDVLGNKVEKRVKNYILMHNGSVVSEINAVGNIKVFPGDKVEFERVNNSLKVGDFIVAPCQGNPLRIKINGEEFIFPGSRGKILLNGKDVTEDSFVNDGDIIRTVSGRDAEAALVDIFKYISVEPNDTVGKRLKLFVNQQEASFTTPLCQNAEVSVAFE